MYCKSCGTNNPDGLAFCTKCGAPVKREHASPRPPQPQYQPPQRNYYQQPVRQPVQQPVQMPVQVPVVNVNVPDNTPSVGSFMGWMLIPAIPLVGLILIIIFACDNSNKVRQNYFKANLFWMLIGIGLVLVFGLIFAAAGIALFDY